MACALASFLESNTLNALSLGGGEGERDGVLEARHILARPGVIRGRTVEEEGCISRGLL